MTPVKLRHVVGLVASFICFVSLLVISVVGGVMDIMNRPSVSTLKQICVDRGGVVTERHVRWTGGWECHGPTKFKKETK